MKRISTSLAALSAALLGSGLSLSPARANYRAKAEAQTQWIQDKYYDAQAGLYRPAFPVDPKALPYEFMWGNGVQFSSLVGATRYNPTKYRPIMDAFAKGLEKYWDKDAAVPGFDAYFASKNDDDKYYDDNQWLTLGFAEAYTLTRDPKYLQWAKGTHRFALSGLDAKLGGGIYWYQKKPDSKNTCSNAPAAAGALALYALGERPQLTQARDLVLWTTQKLQDPADGLFWDNMKLDGTIEKTKWTYNTALMIRSNLGLWRTTKAPKYLQDARRQSDASLKYWVDPATGGFKDDGKFNHLLSEALLETYAATRDIKYLNAVRRDADFAYRYVRDPAGGYWNAWKKQAHAADERKTLIENASAARLFWLLTPYPDVEELSAQARAAEAKQDWRRASALYRQAVESTSPA